MADIYLIRHGKTVGNMEKRYVGRTDEPLCEAGIREINGRRELLLRSFSMTGDHCERLDDKGSDVETRFVDPLMPRKVYVSPMLRCRQTAQILFPDARQEVITEFREMDFGQFEYKNYEELVGNRDYQAFIDSGGKIDFPDAEPQLQFRDRVQKAFQKCLWEAENVLSELKSGEPQDPLVFVVHGGTIMAIMEAYARPHRDYFDWQVSAARGYRCVVKYEKDGFYLSDVTRIL